MQFETLESRTLLSADPLGLVQVLIPANYEFQAVISAAFEHAGSVASDSRNDGASPKGGSDESGKSAAARAGDPGDGARSGAIDKSKNGTSDDRSAVPDLRVVITGSQNQMPRVLAALLEAVAERTDRSFEHGFRIVPPQSVFAREPSAPVQSAPVPSATTLSTKMLAANRPAPTTHASSSQADKTSSAEPEAMASGGDDMSTTGSMPTAPQPTLARADIELAADTRAPITTGTTAAALVDGSPSQVLQTDTRTSEAALVAPVSAGPLPMAAATAVATVSTAHIPTGANYRDSSPLADRAATPGTLTTDARPSRADGKTIAADEIATLAALPETARQESDSSKPQLYLGDLGYPQPLLTANETADTSLHTLVGVTAIVSIAAARQVTDRRRRDSGTIRAPR